MDGDSLLDGKRRVSSGLDDFAYAGRLGYPLKISARLGSNGLENPNDFFADLLSAKTKSRRLTRSDDIGSSDQFSDQDHSVPQFELGWDGTPSRTKLPPGSAIPRPKVSTPTRELAAMSSADAFRELGGGKLVPPSPIGGSDSALYTAKGEQSTIRDSIQYSRARPSSGVGAVQETPEFRVFASSDSEGGMVPARAEKTAHPHSTLSGSDLASPGPYQSAKRTIREFEQRVPDTHDVPDDLWVDGFDDYDGDQSPALPPSQPDDFPDSVAMPHSLPAFSENEEVEVSLVDFSHANSGDEDSGAEASDYNSDASVMDMISENEAFPRDNGIYEPTLVSDDSDVYEEWGAGDMDGETTLVVPQVEAPALNADGLRRSRRHKIPPVRYWLGEKPVYKFAPGTFLPTLKQVVRVEAPAARDVERRRRKPRNDDLADKSTVVAQVFDTEKMSFEFREVAKKLDWDSVVPTKNNPKVKVQVLFPHFDNLPISIEGLCFERGARIPEQNTGPYAYVVSVLTGHFQFSLHQETIELRRGASLGVQRGNDFGVENVGYAQGTLFMIKIHADMFERGILNEESFSNLPQQMSQMNRSMASDAGDEAPLDLRQHPSGPAGEEPGGNVLAGI